MVAEGCGFLKILICNRLLFFLIEPFDIDINVFEIRWLRHRLEAHAGSSFVDYINGLVGQAAACDVATGKLNGAFQRTVGDLHAVVGFVAVAQAL